MKNYTQKTVEDFDKPLLCYLGDTALSVNFGEQIDPKLIAQVHAFDSAFNKLNLVGVIETVPTYRAITIFFDPLIIDLEELETSVMHLASNHFVARSVGRVWEVPVTYGDVFGTDLKDVAARLAMTENDLIEAHTAPLYLVAMVGFLPGFSYLSGLDPILSVPRLSEPRAKIPSSSISIGGSQTAIGSLEGPSGWHVIGRTPIRPFELERTPPFLFKPGDRVKFRSISAREWLILDENSARETLILDCVEE